MDISKIKHLNLWAFLFLLLLTLLTYANSFNGGWVFDDMPVIINNADAHLESLDLTSIKKASFSYDAFYRPLSSLSLGLNWYFGQDHIWGYHLVNFVIHVLAAFFLFLSIKLLLRTPRLKAVFPDQGRVVLIAFIAALLWALHPIQIQAVTYIVQRMASMSAMFCIMGVYCFLRARLSLRKSEQVTAFFLCFVCFVCGVTSKENALVLPAVLVLIQLLFFKPAALSKNVKVVLAVLVVVLAVLAGGMVYLYHDNIFAGYAVRYFTPLERLLTQTRVIFFYISQLFWPLPSRFQLEHDIALSTSLFNPLSTLWATLGVVALLVLAIVKARRWPLVSFAILFYFGCHVLESTVMPLEMIYEHRNYLPSMFIGVPLVYGFLRLMDYCRGKFKALAALLAVCAVLVIIALGASTFVRNGVWIDAQSIYNASLERYPQMSRPYATMGIGYLYEDTPGGAAKAVPYLKKALANDNFHLKKDVLGTAVALVMAYMRLGEYDAAQEVIDEHTARYGVTREMQMMEVEVRSKMGDPAGARDVVAAMLENDPGNITDLFVLAGLLQELKDYPGALQRYEEILALVKTGVTDDLRAMGRALLQMGELYVLQHNYERAGACFVDAYNTGMQAEKLLAAWWLVGLGRLNDPGAPPPEPYGTFLHNSKNRNVLDGLERLFTIPDLPEELRTAWQQVFSEHYKYMLDALRAEQNG